MTIKNMQHLANSVWDWSIFDGCFGGTAISVSDVDGCVEKNGQTLFIEAKSPGFPVRPGQHIMFDNWRRTGYASVLVIWGHSGVPEAYQIYHVNGISDPRRADIGVIRDRVSNWFTWACNQKPPPGKIISVSSTNSYLAKAVAVSLP